MWLLSHLSSVLWLFHSHNSFFMVLGVYGTSPYLISFHPHNNSRKSMLLTLTFIATKELRLNALLSYSDRKQSLASLSEYDNNNTIKKPFLRV